MDKLDERIAEFKEELKSETIRVIFKNSGFKDLVVSV
jgi:hypothetical protein